jgi:2-oxoglutarate dehydrogenase E2 component (dihydrolipoamide succinyltransferase)
MDFELPKLADTLVEGTVSRWLKKPGEVVRKGEPLVEIETDKVNSEIESPFDGVLNEILVPEGETVPVGQVLARIAQPGGAGSPATESEAANPAPESEAANRATVSEAANPAPAASRGSRVAEHVRQAARTIPQGVCVRELLGRLDPKALERAAAAAAAAAADGLAIAVLPAARSDLATPALQPGQDALLAPGGDRDGRTYLTLCYDRRRLDDHTADRLLARIAEDAIS